MSEKDPRQKNVLDFKSKLSQRRAGEPISAVNPTTEKPSSASSIKDNKRVADRGELRSIFNLNPDSAKPFFIEEEGELKSGFKIFFGDVLRSDANVIIIPTDSLLKRFNLSANYIPDQLGWDMLHKLREDARVKAKTDFDGVLPQGYISHMTFKDGDKPIKNILFVNYTNASDEKKDPDCAAVESYTEKALEASEKLFGRDKRVAIFELDEYQKDKGVGVCNLMESTYRSYLKHKKERSRSTITNLYYVVPHRPTRKELDSYQESYSSLVA